MKKDKNAFIKTLIVLVIASLSLLAIVYVMQSTKNSNQGGSFVNFFSSAKCGNGVVEGKEECDGNAYSEYVFTVCDPRTSINTCNDSCKQVCILAEDIDTHDFIGGTEDPDLLPKLFDNKGRLVINKDISFDAENFEELCEGSDWTLGEEKTEWFYNEKYQYKLKYTYNEIYNDDLIEAPYLLDKEKKHFSIEPRIFGGDNTSYACRPAGPGPFISLEVEEGKSSTELKDEVLANAIEGFDSKLKEYTIGDWNVISYEDTGYAPIYFHIILLGEDYNYHFSTDRGNDVLLELISNFELVK